MLGLFENDVKMYGTQAWIVGKKNSILYENDVKMYGTQADRKVVKKQC